MLPAALSSRVLALSLAALLLHEVPVDTAVVAGVGAGFSPNSTSIYVVPSLALTADAVFDGWYVGGGLEAFTFINTQFFLQEDLLRPASLNVIPRAGLIFVDAEVFRVRGDLGAILGISQGSVDDGDPNAIYINPSLGAAAALHGEWIVGSDVSLQSGVGATVVIAPFGIVELIPQVLVGFGWRL